MTVDPGDARQAQVRQVHLAADRHGHGSAGSEVPDVRDDRRRSTGLRLSVAADHRVGCPGELRLLGTAHHRGRLGAGACGGVHLLLRLRDPPEDEPTERQGE